MASTTIDATSVNSTQYMQEIRSKYSDYFEEEENDYVSMETFFQLLVAEMSNQDPLEPTSNTEFIGQLANFTALQAQQNALYYSNANYAASLIGKTVSVSSGTSNGVITGVVTSVDQSDSSNFTVTVGGNSYSLKSIVSIESSADTDSASSGNSIDYDGAYAASLIGKYVTVTIPNNAGVALYDGGIVDAIECTDGKFTAVIGDNAYDISNIVRVEDAPEETEEEEASDDTDNDGIPVDYTHSTTDDSTDGTDSGIIASGSFSNSDGIDSGIMAGSIQN